MSAQTHTQRRTPGRGLAAVGRVALTAVTVSGSNVPNCTVVFCDPTLDRTMVCTGEPEAIHSAATVKSKPPILLHPRSEIGLSIDRIRLLTMQPELINSVRK